MELIELLNMLRDQQADKVTQQQIDAIQAELEAIHQIREIQNIIVCIAFGLLLGAMLVLDHLRRQKIAKLEAIIRRADSINSQKRTLDRQAG